MDQTTTTTLFTFPYFVVQKNTIDGSSLKGRVIINIRALNKITIPNAYPVPSQIEILALLIYTTYITTIDIALFFY